MATSSNHGFLGLELTSATWLRNHFRAKMARRYMQVGRLPIFPGERILDVCCGAGHFAEALAQRVGTRGHVTGIDKDPVLIDAAEGVRTQSVSHEQLQYQCVDAAEYAKSVESDEFDAILMFNCLSYFPDLTALISGYKRGLRRGGRIILKDSDMGHILIYPYDQQIVHRVIEAAQESPPLTFDNFLGRRLPELAYQVAHRRVDVDIWSYPMPGPLSAEEKRYISENLLVLMQQGARLLAGSIRESWAADFNDGNERAILHRDDFLFVMHEILAIIWI